jgi:hypothetical protein
VAGRALEELMTGHEAQARFEFGLEVILRGLAAATPRRRKRTR